jgi:hypothetical protein
MSTAASDKGFLKPRMNTDISPMDAVETTAKNKKASCEINYISGEGSIEGTPANALPFKHEMFDFVGGTVPDDTDYPDSIAPVGSTFCRLIVVANVITGAEYYLKAAAGIWVLIGGEQNGIVVVDTTITSAEVLALFATPIEIAPAPGAGKIIVPIDFQVFLDYNSAAYAGVAAGEDLVFKYTNAAGVTVGTVETVGFIDQTNDEHRIVNPPTDYYPAVNAALVAHILVGEIITGDSPVKVRARYKIVDLQT